jgi:hypothetical protein
VSARDQAIAQRGGRGQRRLLLDRGDAQAVAAAEFAASSASSPAITLSSVDLPVPLRPIRPIRSPLRTDSDARSSSGCSP